MNISAILKKYAWLNIGIAFALVGVMVILNNQGINTGQHALLILVIIGFALGYIGFEVKDIDEAEEATNALIYDLNDSDNEGVVERNDLYSSPIVKYVINHLIIFVIALGEAITSTLLIPVLGAILAGLTFIVYLPWLAWRVLNLIRSPSKELKYFDKFKVKIIKREWNKR